MVKEGGRREAEKWWSTDDERKIEKLDDRNKIQRSSFVIVQ